MALFRSVRTIRPDEMAKVIEWLAGHVSHGEEFRKRVSGLAHIQPQQEQEKLYLSLYLEIEHVICQQDSKLCPSPKALRAAIAKNFKLEKFAPTFFTAPFLSYARQVFFLYGFVFERLVAQGKLTPEAVKSILVSANVNAALQQMPLADGIIAWGLLEQAYLKLPAQERERQLISDFKYLVNRLFHGLGQRVGVERARLAADEIFKTAATTFSFLDALPALLPLLPEGVLEHERVMFYSKEKLTEELRKRMRELEAINVSLEEEARKLRSAIAQLETAQERMGSMQQAQGEFIRVVSHQFRTPLSVIRWQSEVVAELLENMGKGRMPEKVMEQLYFINQKAIFLADVLNGVFDLLALESGEFKINRRPVALWEIIDDVKKSRQREASARKIQVVFSKEEAPTDDAYVDQEMVKKVIEVLVANAIQYSQNEKTVTIRLTREQNEAGHNLFRVAVSDQGIGIAKEDQRRIFQKFFRADSAKRTSPDGAGIALYIAKRFLDLHGGEIGFESEGAGKGTTFWFTVPQGTVTNT